MTDKVDNDQAALKRRFERIVWRARKPGADIFSILKHEGIRPQDFRAVSQAYVQLQVDRANTLDEPRVNGAFRPANGNSKKKLKKHIARVHTTWQQAKVMTTPLKPFAGHEIARMNQSFALALHGARRALKSQL